MMIIIMILMKTIITSADGEEELSCRCRPLSLDCTKEHIAGLPDDDDDHYHDDDDDDDDDDDQHNADAGNNAD